MLIGANDVGNSTPIDLFEAYYRQILDMLEIHGIRNVYCGKIPQIHTDEHAFFSKEAVENIDEYNQCIVNAVGQSGVSQLVDIPDMDDSCFTDPVHFSENGNIIVAQTFANAIRN